MSNTKTLQVHLLPTNSSSILAIKEGDTKLYIAEDGTKFLNLPNWQPQNLVLTSDDPIKDGMLVFCDNKNHNGQQSVFIYNSKLAYPYHKEGERFYPIIATTEPVTYLPKISLADLKWWRGAGCPEYVDIEMESYDWIHGEDGAECLYRPKIQENCVIFIKPFDEIDIRVSESALAKTWNKDEPMFDEMESVMHIEDAEILSDFIIMLHTARCTGKKDQFTELLDRAAAYSYVRTNSVEGQTVEEYEQSCKKTLKALVEPLKPLNVSRRT